MKTVLHYIMLKKPQLSRHYRIFIKLFILLFFYLSSIFKNNSSSMMFGQEKQVTHTEKCFFKKNMQQMNLDVTREEACYRMAI